MLKLVIFDLDGTLYNYEQNHKIAMETVYEYVFKQFNIEKEQFNKIYENAKNEVKINLIGTASSHNRIIYFKTFLQKINKNPLIYSEILYNLYWETFLNNIKLYSNVLEVFDYLKSKDIKIAICSNLTTHIQIRKINRLGIENYIDYLLTSEEIGIEKPNRFMFLNILEYFDIQPRECMLIGDDYDCDIIGANNAGIYPILVYNKNIKECKNIKDFYELLKYFQKNYT